MTTSNVSRINPLMNQVDTMVGGVSQHDVDGCGPFNNGRNTVCSMAVPRGEGVRNL